MAGTGLKIWVGRHVDLALKYQNGEVENTSLDLVTDASADFERGFLGESTPLARAIMGHEAGETISYRAGDIVQVQILGVSAELSAQPEDLSERREETMRKAIHDANQTSAILFASSMNSKWGDYDPDGLKDVGDDEDNDEKKESKT
mgnify:CR=1 FL=1